MLQKDKQIYKFSAYGFLKNLRFFDPFIILFFREMGISFLEIGILFSVTVVQTINSQFLYCPNNMKVTKQ